MDPALVSYILFWLINAVAVVSLGFMLLTKSLHERTLAAGPSRELGRSNAVYAVGAGLCVLYVGLMLAIGASGSTAGLLIIQFLPFAIVGLLIGQAIRYPSGPVAIGLVPTRPLRDVGWSCAAVVVGLALAGAVSNAVGYVMLLLFDTPPPQVVHESLRQLQEQFDIGMLVALILSAVIIAPLLEELVFRGVLQTALLHLFAGRRWPALLVASLLFAVTHWWVVSWHGLIPLFVIGLVFGYVYERTGSLLTPILTHALFNAANIAIAVATLPPK